MPGLLADAAAEFDDCERGGKLGGDRPGVHTQQPLIGAREAVFGQVRDGFEQRAAQIVVKIFGMQLFLRLGEARAHVAREFARHA